MNDQPVPNPGSAVRFSCGNFFGVNVERVMARGDAVWRRCRP